MAARQFENEAPNPERVRLTHDKLMKIGLELNSVMEGAVEKLFASVECGESGYAVLLPVATRGVGFASVLEYQRFADIDFISIHAYYRVTLHLFHLKLSLSYRSQTLAPNHPMGMIQPLAADDINLLMGVSQVPLATYTILHVLGTAHTPDDYCPVLRSPRVSYNWTGYDPEELHNIDAHTSCNAILFFS
ncbi:hypothetical protein RUM44_004454 [Polyplax serrata]|uniref:Uncharacterized protein n=1 Tax=Polyplax serrata TaxID=468196 RepID=A0ABR1B2X6_POLSC